MKKNVLLLFWLTLFSLAMGYLESAVAIYLRKIYFPEGFAFPLTAMDTTLSVTELGRELATVIMLLAIGWITGKTLLQKFAWFAYCFAVWDIFYYVFLKLLLGWPVSWFTWDLLFLLPVPWIGPVLAPVIVSATLIILALLIVYFTEKQKFVNILTREWLPMILGCGFIFLSFVWDFLRMFLLLGKEDLSDKMAVSWEKIFQYVPVQFNWPVFITGEMLFLGGILLLFCRLRKKYSRPCSAFNVERGKFNFG